MHYFFQPIPPLPEFILQEEESAHVHVLRLQAGNQIGILDGLGKVVIAQLITIDKKKTMVKVLQSKEVPAYQRHLHLALVPPKNIDRYEWFLEKATELGVSEITPILSTNSERKQLNLERLKKIIIASIKQSGRAWLPILHEPIKFESFLKTQTGKIWLAHRSGRPVTTEVTSMIIADPITVCIGPEGDFSQEELDLASAAGVITIHLGSYRLRTETAGIYLAALFATL